MSAIRVRRPVAETGLYNRWILGAASVCRRYQLTPEQAFDFITDGAAVCGRHVGQREIREAIQTAYGKPINGATKSARVEVPAYDPGFLARFASRVKEDVTREWLAEKSIAPLPATPSGYLDAVFAPGDVVFATVNKKSKGGYLYHVGDPIEAEELNEFSANNKDGCWYLSNAVTGTVINDSVRSEPNLTSFRHAVMESDVAPTDLWLKAIVQLHLPIVAIYTSGNRSIHALFRTEATSKTEFDQIVRVKLLPQLALIGADPGALTAVRLTRLPCVTRRDNGKRQELIYIKPSATSEPIL